MTNVIDFRSICRSKKFHQSDCKPENPQILMFFDSCHQNEEDYEPAENAEGNVLAHDHIEIIDVECTSKSNKGQVIALADYREKKRHEN